MRSRLRLIIGMVISTIFLAWALSGLDFGAFMAALRAADYWWLVPGVAVYFVGVWARTWRWQYMLRPLALVPLRPLFRIVCIGYMGNNVFPARAGEILRSIVLKQEYAVSITSSLATVLIERLFDGLTMLLFVFVALPLVRLETAALQRFQVQITAFTVLFLAALVAFLAIAARPDLARRLYGWPVRVLVPHRYQSRLLATGDRFLVGFESLSSGRDVLMIFVTSVFVWLCETGKYWFVMHAFPFDVSFVTLMLMNGIVNLFTTLPAAPGYLGTFDAPGIAILEAAGVPQAVATAYTLVLHVALWLPITVLGAYYLWQSRINWRRAKETVAAETHAEVSPAGATGEQVDPGAAAAGSASRATPAVDVGATDGDISATAVRRVAVVGAGFAGLAAAYDLARAGHAVTVLEALDKPGGLAAGFRDDRWDWPLEHYYHHLFTSDDAILDLVRETGFGDRVIVRRPITAYQYRGRPYALDGVMPVLRFPGIPFVDRVRMGLVIAYLKVQRDWRGLENVTVRDWVRKWMGAPAYDAIWEPLLVGKFGDHHEGIPMCWLWARLHKRSMRLIYFDGGFQAFADHLQSTVEGLGVRVSLRAPVEAIVPLAGGGFRVAAGGMAGEYDDVIFTTAPHLLARLVADLPAEYLAGLRGLRHLGAIVAVLALDRRLMTDVYWLSLDKREHPFLACVEHTNFMDTGPYGGDHLVYVGDYLPTDHRYFELSDEELLAEWLPALTPFNPAFDPSWVRRAWVSRTAYAQPVFPLGFSASVPPLPTPIPGLYLASMSQVYPWDRGTNFAVEIGRQAARLVIERGTAQTASHGRAESPDGTSAG